MAALTSITQASYLNTLRSISNGVGSQMAMQSSIFSRLGEAASDLGCYIPNLILHRI